MKTPTLRPSPAGALPLQHNENKLINPEKWIEYVSSSVFCLHCLTSLTVAWS